MYSVTEVAEIFSVHRDTVIKWLSIDDDDIEAVIPPEAWFKLPNGHIRIKEWIIQKLMGES